MLDWWILVALAITAMTTASVSGLLGAGGSILFIPAALFILPALTGRTLDAHQVTSLSLVQGVSAVVGGARSFHQKGQIDATELCWAGPIMAIAGFGGGLVSAILPSRFLLIVFAVVASVAGAILLLKPRSESAAPGKLRRAASEGAFLSIGLLGGAVGVGAGFLSIPTLVYLDGLPMRVANGTALILTLFLSAPALLGKTLTGQVPLAAAVSVAIGAVAGAMIGSRFNARVSAGLLRGSLAVVVAVIAVRVWVEVLT